MDIQEYSLLKSHFPKFEYVVDNSAELHLRFDKLFTKEDTHETTVSECVEIRICKYIDESHFPVTLREIVPDGHTENVVLKTRMVKSIYSALAQRMTSKHDNRISITIVSTNAKADISDIDCIKVFVASGTEDEAEMIKYINEKDNCKDIVTRKERIAHDVSNLLGVIALKPLKHKCEKLSHFMHGKKTKSASSAVGRRVKSDVEKHVELSTNTMSMDVDKATCEGLLEEILALYKIINIPDTEKPAVTERTKVDVSKELCQTLFAISPSIKRMGYRYSKFYIYAVERGNSIDRKERNDEIDKVLKEHGIYDYEIAPCTENIKEFSFVGASIEARSDAKKSVSSSKSSLTVKKRGTLGCFVNLKDPHGRLRSTRSIPGAVFSRHVALGCDDLYDISNGSDKKIGRILQETCLHEHGSLDIAAAQMHVTPESTKFKNSTEVNLPGKLHNYTDEDSIVCCGRKVHIWGAMSRPGYGIITAPKVMYDGMNDPLIQIEDKDAMEGKQFAKEGDSGAIVCADDPEKKCVHALAMVVGTPTPGNDTTEEKKMEYLTLPLSRGLAQIQRKIGKSIDLC